VALKRDIFIGWILVVVGAFFAGCAHTRSGSPAAAFVREGLTFFNTGRFDEAAILFRKANAADPYYAPAYTFLGRIYQVRGDTYRAEMFYRKALALDDTATEIYGWIGDIYWEDGDTARAVEFYERCPSDDPHYAVLHYRLGMRAFQSGRSRTAREEFEKALVFPDYWGGHYGIGLLKAIDGRFEEAIEHLEAAECDSTEPELIYWLAKSYYQLGREPEAYLYYRRYSSLETADDELKREAEKTADELEDKITRGEGVTLDTSYVIPFIVEKNTDLSVGIYDIDGRLVKTLFRGCITRGDYTLTWDGTDADGNVVDHGIYLGFVDDDRGIALRPMLWNK